MDDPDKSLLVFIDYVVIRLVKNVKINVQDLLFDRINLCLILLLNILWHINIHLLRIDNTLSIVVFVWCHTLLNKIKRLIIHACIKNSCKQRNKRAHFLK